MNSDESPPPDRRLDASELSAAMRDRLTAEDDEFTSPRVVEESGEILVVRDEKGWAMTVPHDTTQRVLSAAEHDFREQLGPLRSRLNGLGSLVTAEQQDELRSACDRLRSDLRPLVDGGLSIDTIAIELHASLSFIEKIVHTNEVPTLELSWKPERLPPSET